MNINIRGNLLKSPIEDYINKYQINNIQMPNMFNNNFINQVNMSVKTINFKTTRGRKTNLIVKCGTTIDQLSRKYFNKIGRPELYDQECGKKIFILYNAQALK